MNHPLENKAIADIDSVANFKNYEQEAWYLSRFIQSHGVLMILDESQLTILQISDNTTLLLGMTPNLTFPVKCGLQAASLGKGHVT